MGEFDCVDGVKFKLNSIDHLCCDVVLIKLLALLVLVRTHQDEVRFMTGCVPGHRKCLSVDVSHVSGVHERQSFCGSQRQHELDGCGEGHLHRGHRENPPGHEQRRANHQTDLAELRNRTLTERAQKLAAKKKACTKKEVMTLTAS